MGRLLLCAWMCAALSCGLEAAPAGEDLAGLQKGRISLTTSSPRALELYRQGDELLWNFRFEEAQALFRQALALDPGFAMARAVLGQLDASPAGTRELQRAAAEAVRLPLAERLVIHSQLAQRQGARETSRKLSRHIARIAPEDYEAQFRDGDWQMNAGHWATAIEAYQRTLALNPEFPPAYNNLGYALAMAGRGEEGIEAERHYVRLRPREANSYDTLAQVLLLTGRIDEAEGQFARAAEVNPRFWLAQDGRAFTRFYAGDFHGADVLLVAALAEAKEPLAKLELTRTLAWFRVGAGDVEGALRAVDAVTADVPALRERPGLGFLRGTLLLRARRPADAVASIAASRQLVEGRDAAEGGRREGQWHGLSLQLEAEVALGRTDDASRTLADLEEAARKLPGNDLLDGMRHVGRGRVAALHGDLDGAVAEFGSCAPQDLGCQEALYRTLQLKGDAATANSVRRRILGSRFRNPPDAALWAQLVREGDGLAAAR